MPKFLANENVPGEVVEAVRRAGHDLAWIAEVFDGIRGQNRECAASSKGGRIAVGAWTVEGGGPGGGGATLGVKQMKNYQRHDYQKWVGGGTCSRV
jgi:hypothetical protein